MWAGLADEAISPVQFAGVSANGFATGTDVMHAEPIAALDALKPASLAPQSTHGPRYAPFNRRGLPERRETTSIAPIVRDPCEKCGYCSRPSTLKVSA